MTDCSVINNFIKNNDDNFMNMNNSQLLNCDQQNIQEFCSLPLNDQNVITSCYKNINTDNGIYNFFGSDKSTIIENFPILFRTEGGAYNTTNTIGTRNINFNNLGFTYSNILKFPLNIFQWNTNTSDIKGVFSTISDYYYIIYSKTNIIRINNKFENVFFHNLHDFIDDFVKINTPDENFTSRTSSFLKLNIQNKRIQCVFSNYHNSFDLLFKNDNSNDLVFLNSPENSGFKINDDNSKFVYINNTPKTQYSPVYLCISDNHNDNDKITIYFSVVNNSSQSSKIVLEKQFYCDDIWLVNKSNINYLVCYNNNDNTCSYFKSPITLVDCFDANSDERSIFGNNHGTADIHCNENEVMTGACTSGKDKNCNGNSFKVICTKINEGHKWTSSIRPNNSSKNQGSWNYCNIDTFGKEEAIVGMCSSGKHADCNYGNSSNQVYCAVNPFIYTSSATRKLYEGEGHSVVGKYSEAPNCHTNDGDYQYAIKFCTSGENADCKLNTNDLDEIVPPQFRNMEFNAYTGINCSKECKVLKQLSTISEEDMEKLNEKIKIYDFDNDLEQLPDNAKRFYWSSFTIMTGKHMYSPHNRTLAIYNDGQIELSLINTRKIFNENSITLYNNGNITIPSFNLDYSDNDNWQTNTLFTQNESGSIEYNIKDINYKITQNSNYIIKRDNNVVTVYINKYNSPLFRKYCNDNETVDCTQIFKNYCKHINNDNLELGDNTPLGEFVDDSCTCVANKLIAENFFKNDVKSRDILGQAPCLFKTCADFSDSNTNTYIHDKMTNTCDTITTICNAVVNNQGQMNNEVILSVKCGNQGLTCENTTGCQENQKCVDKQCVPVNSINPDNVPNDNKKDKTRKIILLIILLVILVVLFYYLLKD